MIALAPIFSNAGKHTYSQSMPMSNAKKIMAIFILFACHEDVAYEVAVYSLRWYDVKSDS